MRKLCGIFFASNEKAGRNSALNAHTWLWPRMIYPLKLILVTLLREFHGLAITFAPIGPGA
jgi:hypothetical protein